MRTIAENLKYSLIQLCTHILNIRFKVNFKSPFPIDYMVLSKASFTRVPAKALSIIIIFEIHKETHKSILYLRVIKPVQTHKLWEFYLQAKPQAKCEPALTKVLEIFGFLNQRHSPQPWGNPCISGATELHCPSPSVSSQQAFLGTM